MTNAYAAYSHLLYMKSDALGLPLSGTFELTARCNFDCKMCYIHRRANDAAARQREWSAGRWLAPGGGMPAGRDAAAAADRR